MKKLKNFKNVIFALIALILIVILISQISPADLIDVFSRIKLRYILLALFLYALGNIFRSLRFNLLLNKELKLRSIFKIVCIHNMCSGTFPARLGELSYIHLLKRYHDLPLGESVASLTFARILDFYTVVALFIISTFFVRTLNTAMFVVLGIVVIISLLLFTVSTLLICHKERFVRAVEAKFVRFKNTKFWSYVLAKLKEILDSYSSIHSPRRILLASLYSLLLWSCLYLVSWVLTVKGMRLDLTLFELIVVSTFVLIAGILPINALAGYGTNEGVWTLTLMSFGILKTEAISSGFCAHTIVVVFFLFFGLIGLFLKK